MGEPRYAEFNALPCRYSDSETWIFVNGKWKRIDIAHGGTRPDPAQQSQLQMAVR